MEGFPGKERIECIAVENYEIQETNYFLAGIHTPKI